MKTTNIILIVIIAVAIGIIISTSSDASKYVSFKEAYEMAAQGDHDKVHVVGKLMKASDGAIQGMFYNPLINPNHFEFVLVDNNKESHSVVYQNAKPQDFDKSEQVVVVGSVKGNVFVADEILMKCPSKYEEKEVKAASL
ncbi:MAG TPA: cytochrome c maturation protein CcmE [Cytophagaceae bacterium]|jgi:cytochrome c-type biogenesis protein CcmE|nr:cytochrome c maturation protein CcmE [Cytophagaceae bacterium]